MLVGGSAGTSYFGALWSSGRLSSGVKDVRVITRRPERFDADVLSKLTVIEVESVKIWGHVSEEALLHRSCYWHDDS